MIRASLLSFALIVSTAVSAVEWRNLDEAHRLGGRKASEGYLQGKVVMVCRWDVTNQTGQAGQAMLERVQEVWESFKTKQFVVLGAPFLNDLGIDGAKEKVAEAKLSFPVYAEAGRAVREPKYKRLPTLYVVDETGLVIYVGKDDRLATQAIVSALTDMDAPKNLSQWTRFLDYEIEHLPCHAYLRLKAFNRKFPKDAAAYRLKAAELLKDADVKKVADLVEFAKRAKDPPVFGPKDKAKRAKYEKLVADVIEKCVEMKNAGDPRVAQEAKNALADLKWAQAGF